MAYMSQERKKAFAVELKKHFAGTGIKYSLGVHNHSTIVLTLQSGPIDFLKNYNETISQHPKHQAEGYVSKATYLQVNTFWYQDHFTGKALEILSKVIPVLNAGNHRDNDPYADYQNVGWYVDVNIGRWDKPYQVTA